MMLMVLSIITAVYLGYTHAFEYIFSFADGFSYLGIFVVGFFFTSVFTVPPAIVALGQLSLIYPWPLVVILGALGAACGDYFLFRFVKDRIAADAAYFLRNSTRYRRIMHLATERKFRYLALAFAVVLIASPLPDETALTILGVSRSKVRDVILLTFLANAIGITLIAIAAGSIAG